MGGYFERVEIVSEKQVGTYAEICARHGLDASAGLMVGNSMRSDILPALEAGMQAAHLEHGTQWAHEQAAAPEGRRGFAVLGGIAELLGKL